MLKRNFHLILILLIILNLSVICSAKERCDLKYFPYIVSKVAVKGYIKQLKILKKFPDILYASVGHWGFKPSNKTGFYIFDISRKVPQTLYYYPVKDLRGRSQFTISNDEKTLLIFNKGVEAFDITNPKTPNKLFVNPDIKNGIFSEDDNYLYVNKENSIGLYRFKKNGISFINDLSFETKGFHKTREMYLLPDNSLLRKGPSYGYISSFNLSNPEKPIFLYEEKRENVYPISSVKDNKMLFSISLDNYSFNGMFFIADVYPEFKKRTTLPGIYNIKQIIHINKDWKSIYFAGKDDNIYKLDITDPEKPKIVSEYSLPDYYGAAALDKSNKKFYVGLLDRLIVIDPSKAIVSAENIKKAYNKAKEIFPNIERKKLFQSSSKRTNAIKVLKASGIRKALKSVPSGISKNDLAIIINDFGKMLESDYKRNEAYLYFRRAVELDPDNAEYYLSLGDNLYSNLHNSESFEQKINQTKELIKIFSKYKKLGGVPTERIESFLSFNIVNNPIIDFSEYVVTYSNKGRFNEIVGSGLSVRRLDGNKYMRIDIKTQGTARVRSAFFFDKKTDMAIHGTREIPKKGWCTVSQNTDIIPFYNGHYLLYSLDYGFFLKSTPVGYSSKTGKVYEFENYKYESFNNKKSQSICNDLKTVNFLDNRFEFFLTEEQIKKEKYYYTSAERCLKVDFNNDGKEDYLVELRVSSGAGRGCGYVFYDLLNNKRDGFSVSKNGSLSSLRKILLKMQDIKYEEKGRNIYLVPSCNGNEAGWLKYKGLLYFRTKSGKTGDQFHKVSYLKNGRIHRVCNATFKRKVSAKEIKN